MATPVYKLIDIGGSPELQRRQMNINFALLAASIGGYGPTLPDPSTVMEHSYFTLYDPPSVEDIYQLRNGVWVNLNVLFSG